MNSQTEAKEIQIPLNNGFLAAKEWGLPTDKPFIALHGWQDNAASFDRLIPLLSSSLHIVAFDYIGHGKSSHKFLGLPYYKLEFVFHIKLVADHFHWKKFSILGHNWGSELAIVFSSIYPEMIEQVIGIDFIEPITYCSKNIPDIIKWDIEQYKTIHKKIIDNQQIYTKEEAIKHILNNGIIDCNENQAMPLIERCMEQIESDRFILRYDPCIKYLWEAGFNTYDLIKKIVINIECDLLLIKIKKPSMFDENEKFDEYLKMFSEKCNRFKYVEIQGNHYIHMSYPERIVPVINKFIEDSRVAWHRKISNL